MPEHSAVPNTHPHKPAVELNQHETLRGSETVTMIFPRDVTLLLQDYSKLTFKAGAQEVPVDLKDHWYLRHNGVLAYEPRAPKSEPPEALLEKAEEAKDAEPAEKTDETEPEEAAQPRRRKRI